MNNIARGLVAGFAATIVLSALMLMKSVMGLMPELDVITMLSAMMGSGPALAWLAHLMIGTVAWGGLFGLIEQNLPGGSYWVKGIVLGVGAWILMMIMVMPMAGAGLFGLGLGIAAPLVTLMLHAIFGAVLGGVCGALPAQQHLHRHAHY